MGNYFENTKSNFMTPHSVVENPKFRDLTLCAKYLYCILCKIANRCEVDKDGWFYHSITQLSEKSGLNRKTVIKAKKILRLAEFIDVKRGYLEHTGKRAYDFFRLNGFVFRGQK